MRPWHAGGYGGWGSANAYIIVNEETRDQSQVFYVDVKMKTVHSDHINRDIYVRYAITFVSRSVMARKLAAAVTSRQEHITEYSW